jgi:hypothetical protein
VHIRFADTLGTQSEGCQSNRFRDIPQRSEKLLAPSGYG